MADTRSSPLLVQLSYVPVSKAMGNSPRRSGKSPSAHRSFWLRRPSSSCSREHSGAGPASPWGSEATLPSDLRLWRGKGKAPPVRLPLGECQWAEGEVILLDLAVATTLARSQYSRCCAVCIGGADGRLRWCQSRTARRGMSPLRAVSTLWRSVTDPLSVRNRVGSRFRTIRGLVTLKRN